MVMEILLSEQTQGVFLAIDQRQTKHKGAPKKKVYETSRLQLHFMHELRRRILITPFFGVPLRHSLLELAQSLD